MTTHVSQAPLVQEVGLALVVVVQRQADYQRWVQLAWILAGCQPKQEPREAGIVWSLGYHPIQLSIPTTQIYAHTLSHIEKLLFNSQKFTYYLGFENI